MAVARLVEVGRWGDGVAVSMATAILVAGAVASGSGGDDGGSVGGSFGGFRDVGAVEVVTP